MVAYEKMTVAELKKLIKEKGLTPEGTLKADLVRCLKENDGGGESSSKKNKRKDEDDDDSADTKPKRAKKEKKKKDEDDDEDEEKEEEEEEEKTTSTRSSGRVKAQKVAAKQKEESVGNWDNDGSVYFLNSSSLKHSKKIASFDMDDTLIETKSGRTFALGRSDWQWFDEAVPKKLRELHADGWKVVIFTNQAGITSQGFDKGKLSAIEGKIEDLGAELGFPLQAFIASADDIYRKPATAMWDLMVSKYNGGIKPDLEESIFVGDAAGRAAGWKAGRKKDFSCSDRKYAKNIGIKFATPEEYFLDEASAEFEWGTFELASIPTTDDAELTEGGVKTLTSTSQEIVLFVGFPASGKSTLARRYMVPAGYTHVNRDTLKTKEKCFKVAKEAVDAGKSVVVDNTNPDQATRASYISLGEKAGIPVRCFRFEVDEKLANHLNYFRERLGITPHVPRIGYNMYKKNFQEPDLDEGFTEIKKIKFVKHFEDPSHEKMFDQAA